MANRMIFREILPSVILVLLSALMIQTPICILFSIAVIICFCPNRLWQRKPATFRFPSGALRNYVIRYAPEPTRDDRFQNILFFIISNLYQSDKLQICRTACPFTLFKILLPQKLLIKDRSPWEETDSPPPPEQVMELEHAPSWLSVKSIMPFMIFPQRAAGLSS